MVATWESGQLSTPGVVAAVVVIPAKRLVMTA
jgi:hypothetical protein